MPYWLLRRCGRLFTCLCASLVLNALLLLMTSFYTSFPIYSVRGAFQCFWMGPNSHEDRWSYPSPSIVGSLPPGTTEEEFDAMLDELRRLPVAASSVSLPAFYILRLNDGQRLAVCAANSLILTILLVTILLYLSWHWFSRRLARAWYKAFRHCRNAYRGAADYRAEQLAELELNETSYSPAQLQVRKLWVLAKALCLWLLMSCGLGWLITWWRS